MNAIEAVKLAAAKKTIIPAFNIPYLPMVKPVTEAIRDENSIAMVQVARLEWEKFQSVSLEHIAEEYAKYAVPGHTLLHLDGYNTFCTSFKECVEKADQGEDISESQCEACMLRWLREEYPTEPRPEWQLRMLHTFGGDADV